MRGVCLLVVALTAALSGCAKSELALPGPYRYPDQYPDSTYTRETILRDTGSRKDDLYQPPERIRQIARSALQERFPPPWKWTQQDLADDSKRELARGQRLYQEHCIHCHGIAGGGDGPTAAYLMPRPRDFRRGIYKWKSTQYAAKPTREDLKRMIWDGANGTSMPPFRLVLADDVDAVVDYVLYLSKRGEYELRLLSKLEEVLSDFVDPEDPTLDDEEEAELAEELQKAVVKVRAALDRDWAAANEKIVTLPDDVAFLDVHSREFEESVARGRALFLGEAGCKKCHGSDATANPNETRLVGKDAVDFWGQPNPPRNLTLGLFRGGHRPIDLYRRIHEGITGSAMSGLGATWSSPEQKRQMWDIVNFLRALPLREGIMEPPATVTETEARNEPPAREQSG